MKKKAAKHSKKKSVSSKKKIVKKRPGKKRDVSRPVSPASPDRYPHAPGLGRVDESDPTDIDGNAILGDESW